MCSSQHQDKKNCIYQHTLIKVKDLCYGEFHQHTRKPPLNGVTTKSCNNPCYTASQNIEKLSNKCCMTSTYKLVIKE